MDTIEYHNYEMANDEDYNEMDCQQSTELYTELDSEFLHQPKIPLIACEGAPYVYIVEQPAKCGVRFRYECEGRISSAIPGASANAARFTYPCIAVGNYSGPVKVIVSCVTKNPPYRPHPHNLVGKKNCQQGICVATFPTSFCQFANLGILCAKRKDIKERLRTREQLRIDPFGTGFGHSAHASKMIDLNVIRLCFQVYLPDTTGQQFALALEPIVSDVIYDKKAMSELSIAKLSHYSAPLEGGRSVVMLCDRVIKDDIQIRFFRSGRHGQVIWEKLAQFNSSDIHKHFAISFRVPSYDLDIGGEEGIPVKVQLRRPSDGCTSESITFYYTTDGAPENKFDSEYAALSMNSGREYPHNDGTLIGTEFISGPAKNCQENPSFTWEESFGLEVSRIKCEYDDAKVSCGYAEPYCLVGNVPTAEPLYNMCPHQLDNSSSLLDISQSVVRTITLSQ